jgi:anti-anti-sigma factor
MTKRVVEIKPSITGTAKPSARAILTPKEPLTYQNRQQFKTEFNEAISQDKIEIVLDCKAVPFIDSAGLELLVELDETLRKRGGILKLINVCSLCIDILVATRLINVFHVYSDVYEAIRNGA